MVDLSMNNHSPTWRIGRARDAGINKRLDWFLLSLNLTDVLPSYRVWSVPFVISDHYLVILEWMDEPVTSYPPLKFNHSWLSDESFVKFVCKRVTKPEFMSKYQKIIGPSNKA